MIQFYSSAFPRHLSLFQTSTLYVQVAPFFLKLEAQ